MAQICKGRTVFIIAHRLSAVRDANRIIVMDKGRIVEGGTHEALLQKPTVAEVTSRCDWRITVIDTADLAKVKAQQMTGNIEWDVFDAPGAMGANGSKAGF